MAITEDQVEYVAHLSRLTLTDTEREQFAAQLDSILSYIDKLDELDTENVEPLIHIAPRKNVDRPDQQRPSLSQKEALRNAPENQKGSFRVPPIID
ncbi:MAG: Asp-tRNA(Asn)/Glu-tRNA(Gln) amidotransferase subunit GatC [Candidatus Brocadiia bacterium]